MNSQQWILLIHQIPPKPSYFRVKIWRKLQGIGAVPIKNSVYVLPKTNEAYESFQWIMREIIDGKGEATICEANFIDGLSNQEVVLLFNSLRDKGYLELSEEIKKKLNTFRRRTALKPEARREIEIEIARFKRRLEQIQSLDFFAASGREVASGLLGSLEAKLQLNEPGGAKIGSKIFAPNDLQGRTWVTRRGIHVDRMACAWLIRRFIDAKASFKFVDAKNYKPLKDEIRFDMFDAEFTHEGDSCSFEVIIKRTNIHDQALLQISQIVHDIDLRDEKFAREDTAGIERLINGIALAHREDETRLSRSSVMFDDLYEYFKRRKQ